MTAGRDGNRRGRVPQSKAPLSSKRQSNPRPGACNHPAQRTPDGGGTMPMDDDPTSTDRTRHHFLNIAPGIAHAAGRDRRIGGCRPFPFSSPQANLTSCPGEKSSVNTPRDRPVTVPTSWLLAAWSKIWNQGQANMYPGRRKRKLATERKITAPLYARWEKRTAWAVIWQRLPATCRHRRRTRSLPSPPMWSPVLQQGSYLRTTDDVRVIFTVCPFPSAVFTGYRGGKVKSTRDGPCHLRLVCAAPAGSDVPPPICGVAELCGVQERWLCSL